MRGAVTCLIWGVVEILCCSSLPKLLVGDSSLVALMSRRGVQDEPSPQHRYPCPGKKKALTYDPHLAVVLDGVSRGIKSKARHLQKR